LSDRVDEWVVSHLTEFEGKPLQSVAKGDLDLGALANEAEKKEQEKTNDEFKDLLADIKSTLDTQVKDVRVTHRLTDSPACVVADTYDLSGNLERMLKAAGQKVPNSKPILEINPGHPLIAKLKAEQGKERFGDWCRILFDQSLLAEGGQIEDPAGFVKRLNALMLDMAGNESRIILPS
ncbi:MAG: molecular chaperone HtpG, partial [Burkholderiales bacterium]